MADGQWHDVIRVVHLAGGLRAVNNPGTEVIISLGNDAIEKLSIAQYSELAKVLLLLDFKIIGIDYYQTLEEVQGYYPPLWYPVSANQVDKYSSLDVEDQWNGLTQAALKTEDIELMDICRRIAFEVKACNLRLRKLSEAYNIELWSIYAQGKFSPGKIETLNSFFIYLETHDLLRELCTLRDYLAEFVANFLLKDLLNPQNRIRLMASLRKEIIKAKIENNFIASELCQITDEDKDGWLANLSAYRDLVVHYVPLGQASQRGYIANSNLKCIT